MKCVYNRAIKRTSHKYVVWSISRSLSSTKYQASCSFYQMTMNNVLVILHQCRLGISASLNVVSYYWSIVNQQIQWRRQGGASRGMCPGCKDLCPGCAPAFWTRESGCVLLHVTASWWYSHTKVIDYINISISAWIKLENSPWNSVTWFSVKSSKLLPPEVRF